MSCTKCGVTQCEKCRKKEEKQAFDVWLEDLEGQEQPEACLVNDPDCENCGS